MFKNEFIKRMEKAMETKPIRASKFTYLVNKAFPKSMKIREIYNYGEIKFLRENEMVAVIFDLKMPNKPIALIIRFDRDNNIIEVSPFDNSSKRNLKELSEKYKVDFEYLMFLYLKGLKYKDKIPEIISKLAELAGKKVIKMADKEEIYDYLVNEEYPQFLEIGYILAFGDAEDYPKKKQIFEWLDLLEEENLITTKKEGERI